MCTPHTPWGCARAETPAAGTERAWGCRFQWFVPQCDGRRTGYANLKLYEDFRRHALKKVFQRHPARTEYGKFSMASTSTVALAALSQLIAKITTGWPGCAKHWQFSWMCLRKGGALQAGKAHQHINGKGAIAAANLDYV